MNEFDILQSVFPPDKFDIIIDKHGGYDITSGDLCLYMKINTNDIFIGELHKCAYKGTELLSLVDLFAKKMNISKISLVDGSEIETNCGISISLKYLKLLTSGESWYNSFGYISDNFENEKTHNKGIIDIPFVDMMELVKEKMISEFNKKNSLERMQEELINYQENLRKITLIENPKPIDLKRFNRFNEYVKKLQERIDNFHTFVETSISDIQRSHQDLMDKVFLLFPEITLPAREYVRLLFGYMNRFDSFDRESCEKYKLFNNLLKYLSQVLIYETYLTKTVELTKMGGKRSKYSRQSFRNVKRNTKKLKSLKEFDKN